jgi:hypothetical protein
VNAHLKWRFECNAHLPDEPQGRGHKQEIELAVVRGKDPRPEERRLRELGKSNEQCLALNMGDASFGKGRHEIVCAYCGAPAFCVWVFPSIKGGTYTVVHRRGDTYDYVDHVEVEVLGAEPDEQES